MVLKKDILLSPNFLALIFTIIIIIFLPPVFSKYKITVLANTICEKKNGLNYFHDLNNDGQTECCILHENIAGNAAVRINLPDGSLLNQWNFNGHFNKNKSLGFSDFDNNGNLEIYLIYLRSDSILLGYFEPFSSNFSITEIFITRYNNKLPDDDLSLNEIITEDTDNDSYKEIILFINAGYALKPRGCFLVDINNHTVFRSETGGVYLIANSVTDINHDKFAEIICSSSTTGNINRKSIKYHDSSSWLMVLDHQLNFFFEPVELEGYISSLTSLPVIYQNQNCIISYFYYNGDDQKPQKLLLFNTEGKLLMEKKLYGKKPTKLKLILQKTKEAKNILLLGGDKYIKLNVSGLYFKPMLQITAPDKFTAKTFDMDNDGNEEIFIYSYDNIQLFIIDNKLKTITHLNISFDFYEIPLLTFVNNKTFKNAVCFQSGNNITILNYKRNPLYYARMGIYIGIYLLVLFMIFIIRKQQQIQFRKKKALMDEIGQLQFESIKNQLNPHFTFNVLNSLKYALSNNDKKKSEQLITNLSHLMIDSLENSRQISRPLKEEFEFIRNYLEIQQNLLFNKFDFEIISKPEFDSHDVPCNFLLNFVENAVKHGIIPNDKKGFIRITSYEKDEKLIIEIYNTGKWLSTLSNQQRTGKGLKINHELFELFKKLTKREISHEIQHIDSEDNPGVSVTLVISLKEKDEKKK